MFFKIFFLPPPPGPAPPPPPGGGGAVPQIPNSGKIAPKSGGGGAASHHGAPGPGDGGDGRLGVPGLSPGPGAAGGGAGAAGAADPGPEPRPRGHPRAPPLPGPAFPGRRRRFWGSRGRPGRRRRRVPQRLPGGRVGELQRPGHGQGQRTGHQERDPGLPGRGGPGADLHQQHGGGGAQHPRGSLRQGGRADAVPDAPLGAVPAEQGPGRAPGAGGQRQHDLRWGSPGDAGPAPHRHFRRAPSPAGALLSPGAGPGRGRAQNPPPKRRARPGVRRQRGVDARPGRPRRPLPPRFRGRRIFLLHRQLAVRPLRRFQPFAAGPGRPPFRGSPAPQIPAGAPGPAQRGAQGVFGAVRGGVRPPAEPLHLGRGQHPLHGQEPQGSQPLRLPAALLLAAGARQDRGLGQTAGGGVKGLKMGRNGKKRGGNMEKWEKTGRKWDKMGKNGEKMRKNGKKRGENAKKWEKNGEKMG